MYAKTNYLEKIGLYDLAVIASKISNHTNKLVKEYNQQSTKNDIIMLKTDTSDDFDFEDNSNLEYQNEYSLD